MVPDPVTNYSISRDPKHLSAADQMCYTETSTNKDPAQQKDATNYALYNYDRCVQRPSSTNTNNEVNPKDEGKPEGLKQGTNTDDIVRNYHSHHNNTACLITHNLDFCTR